MKNKRQIITTAQLNLAIDHATTIELNTRVSYTPKDGDPQSLYPREIQVFNNSGTEIEYLFLNGDEEYQEYLLNQTNFDFVRLPDGAYLQDDGRHLAKSTKFLVRKNTFGVQGTADANLCVEFINYGSVL